MGRSYLYIKKNDFDIYFNNQIYLADAVIIEIYDASYIFSNFEKFESVFKKMKEIGMEIYLKLDTLDIKKCYQALSMTKGDFISGWLIPRASAKLLNKFMMKAREYELNQKLNFGTLNFIAIIETPEAIVNYRKIAGYERVKALNINEKSYSDYLGLDYHCENSYVRDQVALYAALSKKPLIDNPVDMSILKEDMIIGQRLGATSKASYDISQVALINEFYTPSKEEINHAKEIVNTYLKASKRKKLIMNEQLISQHKIIKSQELLLRARALGIEEDDLGINLLVKGEKIIDASKRIQSKKFYTLGEEVGNAVTHGVGIFFSLIYFILLLIKGINGNNPIATFAFIVFAFSAFLLYFSSTLYHGLPLGGRAKKLFQRFDHMSIYLLIAGTYTPFTLLALGGSLGIILCITLWSVALVGFMLNLFWFGRFRILHMFLYVALGWVAVFYIKTIVTNMGHTGTALILAGGLAYTIGITFYGLKLFKFTHMVWHIFVLAGTILHFLAIYIAL